jgi:glutathione S-transferase
MTNTSASPNPISTTHEEVVNQNFFTQRENLPLLGQVSTPNPQLELVSHHFCPYVRRAVILLLEKNIPHQQTYINLSEKPDWFQAISPLGKVPLLKVDNEIIFESAAICEYLDETTTGSLHPLDPLEKAKHRAWIEFGSGILVAISGFYSATNEESFEQKRRELSKRFTWVERTLNGKPYFTGKNFSLVDAVYAPIFRYFDAFDAIADFGIFTDSHKVKAWRQALEERPSIQRAFVDDYSQQLLKLLKQRNSYLAKIA